MGAAGPQWPSITDALDAASPEQVFFLALHGGSGEDGTIQELLEHRELAFTGSGAAASRLAFDKVRARERVAARGVRVAEALVIAPNGSREPVGRLYEKYGKIVVKPIADGSSHGVQMIESERQLSHALSNVSREQTPYLAEAFVQGRELTVAVIEEEGALRALPCSEVRLAPGRTFDFDGKYLGKGSVEITPAEVPDEVAAAAQALSRTAHEAVGCSGYSRTDVIVPDAGGAPVFLEINTLPGLTQASFVPQQLEAAGIDIRSFLDDQIHLAAHRRDQARARRDEALDG
jgi:D-alanine-D-alanine ligase